MDVETFILLHKFLKDCYKLNEAFLARNHSILSLFQTGNTLLNKLIHIQDELTPIEREIRNIAIKEIIEKLDILSNIDPDKKLNVKSEIIGPYWG